jgi:hypothetical protein
MTGWCLCLRLSLSLSLSLCSSPTHALANMPVHCNIAHCATCLSRASISLACPALLFWLLITFASPALLACAVHPRWILRAWSGTLGTFKAMDDREETLTGLSESEPESAPLSSSASRPG